MKRKQFLACPCFSEKWIFNFFSVKKSIIVFIVLIFSIVIIACAGRQFRQVRERFIPNSQKTMYIGAILSVTSSINFTRSLHQYVYDYYQTSPVMQSVPNITQANLYLNIEVILYNEGKIVKLDASSPYQNRIVLKIKINLKNVENKNTYVEDKNLSLSLVNRYSNLADVETQYSSIQSALFKDLCDNIDNLIRTGQFLYHSQLGYEGLEGKKSDNLFDSSIATNNERTRVNEGDNYFGNANTNNPAINRQRQIDKIDREGGKTF